MSECTSKVKCQNEREKILKRRDDRGAIWKLCNSFFYYNTSTTQQLLIYCIRIRQVFGIPFLQKNYYNVTYIDSKYIHTICNIEQQEQIINQYSNIRYFRIYTYHIITVISRIKRTSIATIWQNKQMHKLVYIHLY